MLLIKRIIDIVISAILIVVRLPVQLIAAIVIRFTSRGPVLFRQFRAGLNGRKFMLNKVRTIYEGAEKVRFKLETRNEINGPVFKIRCDPRKFSIDELPQLYSVFAGRMSLIEPERCQPMK